jgi:hypothetical protein
MTDGETIYTQCELRRRLPDGSEAVRVAWIPRRLVWQSRILGTSLKVWQVDDSWQDGWVVTHVYATQPAHALVIPDHDYWAD